MATTINLQSSDGVVIPVDVDVARNSCTICDMLDNGATASSSADEIVPLPNVPENILRMFIAWGEHHKNHPEEDIVDHDHLGGMSKWDEEFLKVDKGTLFQLTSAANYLDVKRLLEITCLAIANLFTEKSPKEIRGILNLP